MENNKTTKEKKPKQIMDKVSLVKEQAFECKHHGEYLAPSLDFGDGMIKPPCPNCIRDGEEREKERVRIQKETADNLNAERLEKESEERKVAFLARANISEDKEHATIENWEILPSEEKWQLEVLSQLKMFIDNYSESRGLIMVGERGLGKTHLATGIIKKFINDFGLSAHIDDCRVIVRRVTKCWGDYHTEPEDAVYDFFVKFELLIIDECGGYIENKGEKNVITEILDRRSKKKRPTILISNDSVDDLYNNKLGPTAIERLKEGGAVVVFSGQKSYRDRMTASKIFGDNNE
jgi:DNA replication protein DnaC